MVGAGAAPARLPLSRSEWACLAFGVTVAHLFLVHEWIYPSGYDAIQYVDIARDIVTQGVFAKFVSSSVRTYGYPAVLSLVLRTSTATGIPFLVLLFTLQLAAYIAAAFLLRRALAPVNTRAARTVFCGLLINGYVLLYASQSLSESLSLTLVVLVAAAWVTLWRGGLTAGTVLAGSLGAGFALVVRPANLFLVAAWAFGIAIVGLRQRPRAVGAALCAAALAVGVAAPVALQVRNNVAHYGKSTPFVVDDIGMLQWTLGVQNLKYATAMPPVARPAVYYNNPLWLGTHMDEKAPWRWYVDYPVQGAATLALHTFNLLDQDLLFTYSRDLWPWYRVPLGIVNHVLVALGAAGLVLLGRRVVAIGKPGPRDGYVALVALIFANWAMYAWTDVEMRYGSALLLLLFPLAIYAVADIAARGPRARFAVTLATAAYVAFALALSDWVRDQSAQIREAARSPAALAAPLPSGTP